MKKANPPSSNLSATEVGNQKLLAVEDHLQQRYEFRYNVVKSLVELRRRPSGEAPFQALDDYQLNSISRELTHHHCPKGREALHALLASDFTPLVDPLREYFIGLGTAPSTGSIAQLAATVLVADQKVFKEFLTKWLVAVVANALTDKGCQNHTCLVLTGGQGQFKTTWLDLLCPSSLAKKYLFTGKIHVESKDTQLLLSEYLFINIDDQLRTLNKQDENSLKTLITQPSVNVRRPYGRIIAELPCRASFMGSVNGADFLTDPTGSRRFLPFEVEAINIQMAKEIDKDAVWREAYQLWQAGHQYWFDDEELAVVNERNHQFQHNTLEYDLVIANYKPGDTFLTLAQIKDNLQSRSTMRNLREKPLGEALTRLGMGRIVKRIEKDRRVGGYMVQELVQPEWTIPLPKPLF